MTTLAQLFDRRGGVSVLTDRCEVCNESIPAGEYLCGTCDIAADEDDDAGE